MKISEEQLGRWAKAPSETEENKCRNVVRSISGAMQGRFGSDVSIFLQGSYRNRTNVRQDSDVDIVVLHNDFYFPNTSFLSQLERDAYQASFVSSSYTFKDFKSEVHHLMNETFGTSDVERKNKCIRVNGNGYRVDADVVPCFVHRRMHSIDRVGAEGIEFVTDSGSRVFSFPKQHYGNGVTKNQNANTMYKPVVRILKNVRNILVEEGSIKSDLISSFFLECLVWNVLPHSHFHENDYAQATKNILAQLYTDMSDSTKANKYAEVSDLKWLFRANPSLTNRQVLNFVGKAYNHIGYEN